MIGARALGEACAWLGATCRREAELAPTVARRRRDVSRRTNPIFPESRSGADGLRPYFVDMN